jgi:Tfp pilus assembly protein PilN
MIRLNLLPQDEKSRRRRSSRPSSSEPYHGGGGGGGTGDGTSPLVYLLVIPAFLIAIGAFAYIYYMDVYQPEQERDALQVTLDDLRAEVSDLEGQYANLREALYQYEQQARVVDILMPTNRILWSEKLYQISQCVPDNVYITHIEVNETVNEIETVESIEARLAWEVEPEETRSPTPPEPILVPSIIQTLNIDGIAYSDEVDERIGMVLHFRDNLFNHVGWGETGQVRRFMDHFAEAPRIEYNRIRDVAGVLVNEFRMVLPTVDLASMGGGTPHST